MLKQTDNERLVGGRDRHLTGNLSGNLAGERRTGSRWAQRTGRETVTRFAEIRGTGIRSAGSVAAARGAIPIASAGARCSRWRRRGGTDPALRRCTDRGWRPAVSCFSRACLLARRLIDPCVAPSPLERVSSEKVRMLVPEFSREPRFPGRNPSISGVFAVWAVLGICVPPSRNADSRRGAGRHRTGSDRPKRLITTALRDRATRPARPCSRPC